MEIEDFDDDTGRTTTQLPARERAAFGKGSNFNPTMQGGASQRGPGAGFRLPTAGDAAEGFGIASEIGGDTGPDRSGLASGLQQLGLQDTRPQGFGLDAEVKPSQPVGRMGDGGSRGRGDLQSLGSVPGTRAGLGPAPVRPLADLPQQQDSTSFGLAAETAGPGDPLFRAGGQGPTDGFGLVSELDERPQPQPLLQRPGLGVDYGLDSDVRAAAAGGLLQPARPILQRPSGGYGLDGDIHEAEVEAARPVGPFGLESEVHAAGALPLLPGLWSRPLANTIALEQLAEFPEDQRWLHLEARQAERFILDLKRQGIEPKVVDLQDVREKLIDASVPPRLAYLAAVELATADHRLPPNCRPSLLQTKLKTGQNRLRKLLEPVVDPGGQGFVDLSYSPDGALQPEMNRVWQFGLSLVQADGVGKSGLQRVRQPCLFIARMALFDRRANRFLGNVLGVRPDAVSNYDKRWEFNPGEQVIVRCGCVQSDPQAGTRLVTDDALSVFVEFNVSYRLTVEDTMNIPTNEQKAAQLLDEINTCWAMISFKKCVSLQREVQITVPLYYGSIYDPQPMTAFYAEKRSKGSFWSAFKAKESPVLQFRVGPLGLGKPPLVPYAYMPTTMLATHDLGTAMGAYRMSLSLLLARQAGPFAAAADPVLSGFPPLLSDHHLLSEFLTRWRDLTNKMTAIIDTGCCSPEVLPPLPAFVEAFRRCTVELAPLAHCPTIPPRHINNFVEYQGHRLRLVQHYCHVLDPRSNKILGARHPVEPLSHAGFEFLHAPFDVSELRVCMADRLEHPEPFYRH